MTDYTGLIEASQKYDIILFNEWSQHKLGNEVQKAQTTRKPCINPVNDIDVFNKSSGIFIVLNPKWCFKTITVVDSLFSLFMSHFNSKQLAESQSAAL